MQSLVGVGRVDLRLVLSGIGRVKKSTSWVSEQLHINGQGTRDNDNKNLVLKMFEQRGENSFVIIWRVVDFFSLI